MKANYFKIICKESKGDEEVIWQYESETIHPSNILSLKRIVSRILRAMEILHMGRVDFTKKKGFHDFDDEAKEIIKRNKGAK